MLGPDARSLRNESHPPKDVMSVPVFTHTHLSSSHAAPTSVEFIAEITRYANSCYAIRVNLTEYDRTSSYSPLTL